MIHLQEAVQVTPQAQAQILADPHVLMGFEVEFVYVNDQVKTQARAFIQAKKDLQTLGLQFGTKQYKLMPDNSIDTEKQPHRFGIELVSPPQPLSQGLSDLKQVFVWMEANNHLTNNSTGLHINVSVTGLDINKINKLKLLLLLGEKHVQQQFNRLLNSYTESHLEILKSAIAIATTKKQPWTQIREVQKLNDILNASIDLEKYRTVNFSKLQHGYLEFRIMGNQDYHKRFETVKSVIIKYAYVLLAAMDPVSFQTEYNQALAKLFSQGITQAEPKYPDLSHKFASVGASHKATEQAKVLDYINRAKAALEDKNPNAAVRLITMAIQKADKHTYDANVKPDLINAAALSYRILIKKLFNWDVKQFVQAQAQAKIAPDVIKTVKTYLSKF